MQVPPSPALGSSAVASSFGSALGSGSASVVPPPLPFPPLPPPPSHAMSYAQLMAAHAALPPLPQPMLRGRSIVSSIFICLSYIYHINII